MKATKKSILTLCIVTLVLVGFALAQASDASKDSPSTTSATTPSTTSSTTTDNQNSTSALVLAIESDGDLIDVAEAISLTGTTFWRLPCLTA